MATNYKYTGTRLNLVAAGARTSGNIVSDKPPSASTTNLIAGIATATAATGDLYWVQVTGVFNLVVPSATAAGTLLYVPAAPPTAGDGLVLTATSSSNTLFCKTLTDADASNKADCLLMGVRY